MMLNKLICWWTGHKRGKRVQFVTSTSTDDIGKIKFYCPRCGSTWTRRTKKAAP